jgi:hypothetical protein
MSRSTVTVHFCVQYILYPFESSSKPMKRPSSACISSFPASSFRTHAVAPNSCSNDKSGFFPVAISCRVFFSGSARVGARFRNHMKWWCALAQRFQGRPDPWSNAQVPLMRVLLDHSAMPFEAGKSCTVRCRTVPAFSRCSENSLLVNSPPRSDLKILIVVFRWIFAHASYFL